MVLVWRIADDSPNLPPPTFILYHMRKLLSGKVSWFSGVMKITMKYSSYIVSYSLYIATVNENIFCTLCWIDHATTKLFFLETFLIYSIGSYILLHQSSLGIIINIKTKPQKLQGPYSTKITCYSYCTRSKRCLLFHSVHFTISWSIKVSEIKPKENSKSKEKWLLVEGCSIGLSGSKCGTR